MSDLLPELQGRLPIQVELDSLLEEDFYRILREPKNSLIKQNIALMETEDIELEFIEDAARDIARIAFETNENQDNIGARRLHAVLEKVMDDIYFEGPDLEDKKVVIDSEYVRKMVQADIESDLKHYIL